jgi:hypothetical protein
MNGANVVAMQTLGWAQYQRDLMRGSVIFSGNRPWENFILFYFKHYVMC